MNLAFRTRSPWLLTSLLALSLTGLACPGDDDSGDSGNDSGPATSNGGMTTNDEMTSGNGSTGGGGNGSTGGANDSSGGGGGKALGEDCTASEECVDGLCLMFDVDGQQFAFCTRSCTSADDCPEEGWECNISPYTACVPAG